MATPTLALGYTELVTTPTSESWDYVSGTINAQRQFIGPWEDRIDFVNDHIDAVYPDIPQAVIANVAITGDGVGTINAVTGQATWERAKLVVTYKTEAQEKPRQPKQEEDRDDYVNRRYITENIEGGVDGYQVDGADFRIAANEPNAGDRLNQLDKITIAVPLETITITQFFLGLPNWLEISLAKGKVNYNAFISPSGIAFSSNTLRYEGTSGTTKIDIDTRTSEDSPFPVWELTHKFSHNVIGWNKIYHESSFQKIASFAMGSFDSLYDTADFYSIFFGAGGRTFNTNTLSTIDSNLIALQEYIAGNGQKIKTNTARRYIAIIKDLVRGLGFNV